MEDHLKDTAKAAALSGDELRLALLNVLREAPNTAQRTAG